MKTFLANKSFNSFKLNAALTIIGKPRLLSHGSSYCRPFFKENTLASCVKWRFLIQRATTHFPSSCTCEPLQCARGLHSSSTVNQDEKKKPETLQELVEITEKQETAVTVGQKVVQAGKDVSYFGIMVAGFAVTGALLWYVLSELFLSNSPNKIYADALKKVKRNEEVIDELVAPLKAYGEETSRRRRRHVSFQEYIVAGENYMRVKFYVAGQRRKGTVHVDVKMISSRTFEYRFIFVELEGFPARTIIIEDNR